MKNIKKGFTLIELLIVIAIIGVLAVAFLPSVMGAPSKARDAQRIEQVNKLADFFALRYTVTGTLPQSGFIEQPEECSSDSKGASHIICSNLADFGGVFPQEPDPSKVSDSGYYFWNILTDPDLKGSPNAFAIYTRVENTENGNFQSTSNYLADYFNGKVAATNDGDVYIVLFQK